MKAIKNTSISKVRLIYNPRKLKIARVVDSLLTLLLRPLYKRRNYSPIYNPGKILVIQSHAIGDLVMATPLLRSLKRAYPDSRIFLLANEFAGELLEGTPYVYRIITIKFPWATYDYSLNNILNILRVIKYLRNERFDLAIDGQIDMRNAFLMYLIGAKRRLGYNITGGDLFLTDVPEFPEHIDNLLHARLSILSYLGIDVTDKSTELPIGEENRLWAKSFMADNKLDCQRLIAIHPGTRVKENRWQPDKFAKVIEYLCLKGYQTVIIEGPIDEYAVNAIVSKCKLPILRVKTGLKNVAALISSCRLIICLDSASMHIAGAVKTPAIAIYGTKWPVVTRPFNENISILWDDSFDCRPCKNGHCENIGHSCMDAISAEAVIQEIDKRLLISGPC